MALFFPEWIPWWLQLAIVAIILLFGICFLLMPFAVFGVKGRLAYLERQLDDVQAQLRVLLKRTAETKERADFKIQSVKTVYDEKQSEGGHLHQERPENITSSYAAVSRSRQTRFDPPPEASSVRDQFSASRNFGNRDYHDNVMDQTTHHQENLSVSRQERAPIHVGRREEQLYDPPPKSREEENSEDSSRRRAEPILRWPPR